MYGEQKHGLMHHSHHWFVGQMCSWTCAGTDPSWSRCNQKLRRMCVQGRQLAPYPPFCPPAGNRTIFRPKGQ